MRITRKSDDILVLEHGPWRNLWIVAATILIVNGLAFSRGPAVGMVVAVLSVAVAWLGARRFERVRVVFDRPEGQVAIRRRTGRAGAGHSFYALDEIAAVEAERVQSGNSDFYRLDLVIPHGPHVGRHPVNRYETQGAHIPETVAEINRWLEAAR